MDKRNQRQPPRARQPGLAADYRLLPGIPDEMIDPAGNIRPGWSELHRRLRRAWARTSSTPRFERADQYLRDAGVFYRKYDGAEGKERAWPLAHVPLIIDETDWLLITPRPDAARRAARNSSSPTSTATTTWSRAACCRPS